MLINLLHLIALKKLALSWKRLIPYSLLPFGYATSTTPNSWRGCALSVAMPQALRLRPSALLGLNSGQAQYKSRQANSLPIALRAPRKEV